MRVHAGLGLRSWGDAGVDEGGACPQGEKDTLQVTAGGNQVRLQDGDSQLPLSLSQRPSHVGGHMAYNCGFIVGTVGGVSWDSQRRSCPP